MDFEEKEKVNMKYIVHFSCGAASAVSALITMMYYKDVELVYTNPNMEHESNQVFLQDFEKFVKIKVTQLQSNKFKDPFDVFEKRRFLCSPDGAPCTTELKKNTARDYLGVRLLEEISVFGFDCSKRERARAERYRLNNPELQIWNPLIEYNITKEDCFYILSELGLNLPMMYKMGYKNSNCIGCVKASNKGYWSAIREDFPDTFNRYAKLERELGAIDEETGKPKGAAINKYYTRCNCKPKGSCNKCDNRGEIRHRLFLDELPKDTKPERNISFTCGYSCGAQDMEILASKELGKEPTLAGYMMLQEIKGWLV
jgi:PP-loop superfamily ATP-utilizing enzyme